MTPTKKPSQTEQSRRFIEAAREIGTNEDPDAFKEQIKKLVNSEGSKASMKSHKNTKISDRST
jgi:hypothetical protein